MKLRIIEAAGRIREMNDSCRVYSHVMNCMIFEQQLLYNATTASENTPVIFSESIYRLGDLTHENETLKIEWIESGKCIKNTNKKQLK